MTTSGGEKYIPVRAHARIEQYMTEGGPYTATIWREPSGVWAAVVCGPDGASVCHGLLTPEDAQAWCETQVAAFVARTDAE